MSNDIHIASVSGSIVHLGIRNAGLGRAANQVHIHRAIYSRTCTSAAGIHQEGFHGMGAGGIHQQACVVLGCAGIFQALGGFEDILVHISVEDFVIADRIFDGMGCISRGFNDRIGPLHGSFRLAVNLIDADRSPDSSPLGRNRECPYIVGNLFIADGRDSRGLGADIGTIVDQSLGLRVDKVHGGRTGQAQTAAVIYAAAYAYRGDVCMAGCAQVKIIACEAAAGESGRSMGFVTGDAHAHTNSGGLAHGGHGGIGAEIVSGAGFHIEIASGVLDIRAGHFSGHIGRLQPYGCGTVHRWGTIGQTHAKTNGGQAGCIDSRDIYLGGIMVNGGAIDYSAVYLTISIANSIISHSAANGRPLGQGKAAGYRQFLRIVFGGNGNARGILHRAAGKFGLDIIRTAVYRYGTIGGQLLPGSGHTCGHSINPAFILGTNGNGFRRIICKLRILHISAGGVFQTVVSPSQPRGHIAHGDLACHIDILSGGAGVNDIADHILDIGAADFSPHIIAVGLPAEGACPAKAVRSAAAPGGCTDGQSLAVRFDIEHTTARDIAAILDGRRKVIVHFADGKGCIHGGGAAFAKRGRSRQSCPYNDIATLRGDIGLAFGIQGILNGFCIGCAIGIQTPILDISIVLLGNILGVPGIHRHIFGRDLGAVQDSIGRILQAVIGNSALKAIGLGTAAGGSGHSQAHCAPYFGNAGADRIGKIPGQSIVSPGNQGIQIVVDAVVDHTAPYRCALGFAGGNGGIDAAGY